MVFLSNVFFVNGQVITDCHPRLLILGPDVCTQCWSVRDIKRVDRNVDFAGLLSIFVGDR